MCSGLSFVGGGTIGQVTSATAADTSSVHLEPGDLFVVVADRITGSSFGSHTLSLVWQLNGTDSPFDGT